jgi:hypothetical protein
LAFNIWHVLDVGSGSPADLAGLLPYSDYILGTPDGTLHGEGGLGELVDDFIGRPLRLWIYNNEYDVTREVEIRPSRDWGGEGALGCTLGYGALHRLPAPLSEPVQGPGETLFDGDGGAAARSSGDFAAPPPPGGNAEYLIPAQMAAAAPPPPASGAAGLPTRSAKKKAHHSPNRMMDDYFAEQEKKSRELEGSVTAASKSPPPPPPKAGSVPPPPKGATKPPPPSGEGTPAADEAGVD